MAMNYGGPSDWVFVVNGNKCDMGASAIQAARNLNKKYDVPYTENALTPMIGENDIKGEIFTFKGMQTVLDFAEEVGLAGVHFWSFDRDRRCSHSRASYECSWGCTDTTSVLQYADESSRETSSRIRLSLALNSETLH